MIGASVQYTHLIKSPCGRVLSNSDLRVLKQYTYNVRTGRILPPETPRPKKTAAQRRPLIFKRAGL